MTKDIYANFFTLSDAAGTLQIAYYPYARLEYQGPEGHFVYPCASPGRDMTIQEESFLGQQITIVLIPPIEGPTVNLTFLLPPMNMDGQQEQDFDTIAIKAIGADAPDTAGAQLTYEVIFIHGTAQHLLHPPYTGHSPLPDNPQEAYTVIADEILKMSEVDQQMRRSGQWDSAIDVMHTQRMKEIVEQMAWLLVQHADHDCAFQAMCLKLMKAQTAGEVSPANIAYLEDRVRVGEGRLQLYGTQFYVDEAGNFSPRPIEDIDHVDERRQAVLLQPLSEYARDVEQTYKQYYKR